MVLYGAPLLTKGYDFWIDSKERASVLAYFSKKACGFSHREDSLKPIIQVYAGPRKIDLFFHQSVLNLDRDLFKFKSCYENVTIKEKREQDIFFRIPSIDDLIKTIKIRHMESKRHSGC